MRILLIRPWIHDFSAYDLWIQPLGLLYLAAILEENRIGVDYIDCLSRHTEVREDGRGKYFKQSIATPVVLSSVRRRYGRYGITPEEFRARLSRVPVPDMIFVTSGMTYWYPGVQETISEARRLFPGTKIVLGGIYAGLMPEHARAHSGADIVIDHPFEREVLAFVSPHSAAVRPYETIDDFPDPAWHLTDNGKYRVLLSSRGCPYRCTFCASDILNEEKFLQRSVEKVAEEAQLYYARDGIRHFVFYDDALLIRPEKHILPLLKRLIGSEIKAAFHTPNGLNAREIRPEIAELFFAAGFRTLRLSLESSNAEIQKTKGNNKVNNRLFSEAIENLFRAGYSPGDVEAYLIMGLPGQTHSLVRDTLDYVAQLGVIGRLATFSPIPGTPEAASAIRSIGDAFVREPLLQNHSYFPLKNTSMTEEQMQSIKAECNRNNQSIRMESKGLIDAG